MLRAMVCNHCNCKLNLLSKHVQTSRWDQLTFAEFFNRCVVTVLVVTVGWSYRCPWTTYSFCACLRLAVQQRKLLSSPWFGTLKAYFPTYLHLRRSVFSQTPVVRIVRSVLMISIRMISNWGSQIPHPNTSKPIVNPLFVSGNVCIHARIQSPRVWKQI